MSFRIIKWCLYGLLVIFLLVTLLLQYQAESYRIELQHKYGFYLGRERLSFVPFLVFYHRSKESDNHSMDIYWDSINLPYEQNKLLKDGNTLYYNISYNAYLMYCYYSLDEIERYQLSRGSRPR